MLTEISESAKSLLHPPINSVANKSIGKWCRVKNITELHERVLQYCTFAPVNTPSAISMKSLDQRSKIDSTFHIHPRFPPTHTMIIRTIKPRFLKAFNTVPTRENDRN